MYENVIVKFKNIEGWSKEINCNIGVKQGCSLSPTLFGIYIDKLEDCLEKTGCVGPTLTGISIFFFMSMISFLWQGVPMILKTN